MNFQHFQSLYKTWRNGKQLDILDRPQEYQTLVVEAEKLELEEGGFSHAQLKCVELKKLRNYKNLQQQIRAIRNTVFESYLTEKEEKPKVKGIILRICIFLGATTLYQWFNWNEIIFSLVEEPFQLLDYTALLFTVSMLLLSFAAFLLWKINWWGWNLSLFCFVYCAYCLIPSFVASIAYPVRVSEVFDIIFSKTSSIVYTFLVLFYVTSTWVLTKIENRTVFGTTAKNRYITVASNIAFFLIVMTIYH